MDTQNNTAPEQNNPAQDAANKKTLMGILSYIGPLVIVSFIVSKNDPFVKFHIKQGLVVFSMEVIVWIIGMIIPILWPLLNIVSIINFILSILGIINVVKEKEKALPVVGKFSSYFSI